MKFADWPFANLKNIEKELEDLILEGQPGLKLTLAEVKKEIASRKAVLVAVYNGKKVAEYGRWRTKEEAEEAAKGMGLPVGANFDWDGKKFGTVVTEIE